MAIHIIVLLMYIIQYNTHNTCIYDSTYRIIYYNKVGR